MKSILRLKEILKDKGISTKDFASNAGLSYTYCTELIRGDKFPRQDTLLQIAEVLNVDIRDLFYPTKEVESTKRERLDKVIKELEDIRDKEI